MVDVIETEYQSGEKLDSRSSLGATLAHVAYNLNGFSRYQPKPLEGKPLYTLPDLS